MKKAIRLSTLLTIVWATSFLFGQGLIKHSEWSRNATIYEVNISQNILVGTFAAFERHLFRREKFNS